MVRRGTEIGGKSDIRTYVYGIRRNYEYRHSVRMKIVIPHKRDKRQKTK